MKLFQISDITLRRLILFNKSAISILFEYVGETGRFTIYFHKLDINAQQESVVTLQGINVGQQVSVQQQV